MFLMFTFCFQVAKMQNFFQSRNKNIAINQKISIFAKNNQNTSLMKRLTVILASLLMLVCLKLNAQNERILLFECFTNTSCGPCASQNPALDALINNNSDRIAAIKYHVNWPGANDPMYLHNPADNNARRSVYSVQSVPHTVVDGTRYANAPAGINQNSVNQWLTITSPFEMRLSYEVDEPANTITVNVMGRASEAISGSVKLFVGVIEKAIHYNTPPGSNGERDFYSVMKKLLPGSAGITLDTVQADSYFAYSFTWELANVYNNDQLDAIAWLQNADSRVVYQACKSSQNLEAFFANEAAVSNISNVKTTNCSGLIEPKVQLTNFGSNPLTSAQLEVLINGESMKTVEWTGNMATFGSETVDLGEINFQVEEVNQLEVLIKTVNNTDDEAPSNNVANFTIKQAKHAVGTTVKVNIRTDSNPQETTWKVTKLSTGEVIQEGGPYTAPNTLYVEDLVIEGDGCYDFTIYDTGGDGLAGTGVYGLKAGSVTLFSGSRFGHSESNEFSYEVTADVEEGLSYSSSIYPNPTSGLVNIVSDGEQNVTIYNMAGQRIFDGLCDGALQIDMKRFGAGIYAIKVGNETQRVIVK